MLKVGTRVRVNMKHIDWSEMDTIGSRAGLYGEPILANIDHGREGVVVAGKPLYDPELGLVGDGSPIRYKEGWVYNVELDDSPGIAFPICEIDLEILDERDDEDRATAG